MNKNMHATIFLFVLFCVVYFCLFVFLAILKKGFTHRHGTQFQFECARAQNEEGIFDNPWFSVCVSVDAQCAHKRLNWDKWHRTEIPKYNNSGSTFVLSFLFIRSTRLNRITVLIFHTIYHAIAFAILPAPTEWRKRKKSIRQPNFHWIEFVAFGSASSSSFSFRFGVLFVCVTVRWAHTHSTYLLLYIMVACMEIRGKRIVLCMLNDKYATRYSLFLFLQLTLTATQPSVQSFCENKFIWPDEFAIVIALCDVVYILCECVCVVWVCLCIFCDWVCVCGALNKMWYRWLCGPVSMGFQFLIQIK